MEDPRSLQDTDRQGVVYAAAGVVMARSWKRVCMSVRSCSLSRSMFERDGLELGDPPAQPAASNGLLFAAEPERHASRVRGAGRNV